MNDERNNMAVEETAAVKQSPIKDARDYLIKAIIAVSALTLVGKFAPAFPSFAFPFIFFAYALPSTIGALYYVVINRFHRQLRYNEGGTLSRYNRKWLMLLLGLFVFFLFSGLFFVLEAPKWDGLEWLLIWLAVPFYYLVFLVAQRAAKRELAPKFRKASAIKWSFFIAVIVLSIAYAFISAQTPLGDGATLEEALNDPFMPFATSSCALLSEADKLSSFTDALTAYGLNQIAAGSFAISVVVRFVLCLSIFLGLVNIFSFCLLDRQEMKSEFQLLPANEEEYEDDSRPMMKRYFLVIAGAWVVLALLFLGVEFEAYKMKSTSEYTAVNAFIDEQRKRAVLITEEGTEKVKELEERDEKQKSIDEEYRQMRDDLIQGKKGDLDRSIDEYYDQCINNLDSYLDWHDSFLAGLSRLIRPLGEKQALDKFRELVVDPAGNPNLGSECSQYVNDLDRLYRDYSAAKDSGDPNAPFKPSASEEASKQEPPLELWECLNSENESTTANETLLNTDKNVDRNAFKEKLKAMINQEKARVHEYLNDKTNEYANTTSENES